MMDYDKAKMLMLPKDYTLTNIYDMIVPYLEQKGYCIDGMLRYPNSFRTYLIDGPSQIKKQWALAFTEELTEKFRLEVLLRF